MMQNNLRQFEAPEGLANWCALYMSQVNNYTSRESLSWQTPMEVSSGHTPDISMFRFHFYEPIWYFVPKIKSPKNNLLKARFLALAESAGDAMTYYILTEPNPPERRKVLMRSVIRTRRENIGSQTEFVNDNPDAARFYLSLNENKIVTHESTDEVPILVPGEKLADAFNEKYNPDDDITADDKIMEDD